MRILFLSATIVVLATAGCAVPDPGGNSEITTGAPSSEASRGAGTEVSMKVLTRGSYGKMAQEVGSGRREPAFVEVATTRRELEALWSRYIQEPLPEVSFDHSIVLFLLLPPRPTGGYGIEPNDVSVEGRTVRIDATLHEPGQGDIVTQAFTAPYAVIEIEGVGEVDEIVWRSNGRTEVTKELRK